MTTLVPVDPKSETSVLSLLEHAALWLSEAVHRGEAADVALVKAQIATAAEATKQLNLSKDIQLDAQEMVRRAEYALGKAIRRGQAEGTIRSNGQKSVTHDRWNGANRMTESSILIGPGDFATKAELSGKLGSDGIYAMTDGVEPEDFDQAVTSAKAEGNLSRANVVRKVKIQQGPTTRDDRADLIQELANQGYSSRQMPAKVGVTEERVRQIARDYGIDIPADKHIARTKRMDSNRIASETVIALDALAMGVELIDYAALDLSQAGQWADSLAHSFRALNRFKEHIRKATQ